MRAAKMAIEVAQHLRVDAFQIFGSLSLSQHLRRA